VTGIPFREAFRKPAWQCYQVQPRRDAEATTIPIATGENEYTRYGFRDLIQHNAAAILNADAKVLGGVTEFMKVAALAQAHDLDIAPPPAHG
jgi:L-alanine-DL-glutamate epimerase-like enolase superfamily enzyme